MEESVVNRESEDKSIQKSIDENINEEIINEEKLKYLEFLT